MKEDLNMYGGAHCYLKLSEEELKKLDYALTYYIMEFGIIHDAETINTIEKIIERLNNNRRIK